MRKDDYGCLALVGWLVYEMSKDWAQHENFYIAILTLFAVAIGRRFFQRFRERAAAH